MSYLGGATLTRNLLIGLEKRPSVANAMDDEFDGTALDTGKWSWLDQGGTTASVGDGILTLTLNENTNRMRGIYQTAPSAPWVFTARLYDLAPIGNYFYGLFAGVSTSAEIYEVGVFSNAVRTWSRTTPSTSASATGTTATVGDDPYPIYVSMAYDGTNIRTMWSYDGRWWQLLGHIAAAGTLTIVGLSLGNQTNASKDYQYGWFRRFV